jgi:hypothetical protein
MEYPILTEDSINIVRKTIIKYLRSRPNETRRVFKIFKSTYLTYTLHNYLIKNTDFFPEDILNKFLNFIEKKGIGIGAGVGAGVGAKTCY